MKQIKAKTEVSLDALLTPSEAADWLGVSEHTLLASARQKTIPSIRLNKRVIRFHPRAIIEAKGSQ